MLTAYDYPTAMAIDKAGIDSILVGDSLAMVVLGYENTLPVTMDEMLHHARAVARGAKAPLLVGDMPFMSYQVSVEDAVRNAGRFLQQGGMDAVKLEGGRERADAVRAIVNAGIPVMGHLGLTPQSVNQLGGFRAQGKTASAAKRLLEDAQILKKLGRSALCWSPFLQGWQSIFPSISPFQPLALARDQVATGKCLSLTIYWVSLNASHRNSFANMQTCMRR